MRFDQCTNGNIFMHGWTKEQAVMSDHDKAILQELAKKMAATDPARVVDVLHEELANKTDPEAN